MVLLLHDYFATTTTTIASTRSGMQVIILLTAGMIINVLFSNKIKVMQHKTIVYYYIM